MRIAFFGSSLVSAYWNGAATYYRGILKSLANRGHAITFYEPDAYDRQGHVDHPDPPYAKVVVYENDEAAMRDAIMQADDDADVVVKASGVGVFDRELEAVVSGDLKRPGRACVFWDVDAPATLDRTINDPADAFRGQIPQFDTILTYGGGPPVVEAYAKLGARRCVPIYNACDPDTHHAVEPNERFACDLALLANRLPDREARIDAFFFEAARLLPDKSFLLGGNGWDDADLPANVRAIGHVAPPDHNAFNCTPRAVLNVNRQSMARYGWSPATRVFEAAGAGACLVTDAWRGIDEFLEPDAEVLVAEDGAAVAEHLASLADDDARRIGSVAKSKVLASHTYEDRAELAESELLRAINR
ncbi:MAG: glycosyltransferase [Planctomycetota bacterium]